jgi:4,5-dihydroxyphthalate decarboxylase
VTEPSVLRTVLADYPHTRPLKRGMLTSPGVRLDFREVAPVHKAFAPMVRDAAYDLSELAIVTALQAVAYGRPIVVLPAVMASRFQRGCLIAHMSRPVPKPEELAGRRIGVRSYTQTTGMWVRAHLAEDYGLAAQSVRWTTHDPAHVEQYHDPDFVEHDADARNLPELLRAGRVDAVILGNDLPEGDEFVPVIPDAAERDLAWWERNRFMPINHVVAASASAARRDPAAIREAYSLLRRADALVDRPQDAPSPTMFGFERLRGPIQTTIDTCLAQGLLPRALDVDEVFGPAADLLADLGD